MYIFHFWDNHFSNAWSHEQNPTTLEHLQHFCSPAHRVLWWNNLDSFSIFYLFLQEQIFYLWFTMRFRSGVNSAQYKTVHLFLFNNLVVLLCVFWVNVLLKEPDSSHQSHFYDTRRSNLLQNAFVIWFHHSIALPSPLPEAEKQLISKWNHFSVLLYCFLDSIYFHFIYRQTDPPLSKQFYGINRLSCPSHSSVKCVERNTGSRSIWRSFDVILF